MKRCDDVAKGFSWRGREQSIVPLFNSGLPMLLTMDLDSLAGVSRDSTGSSVVYVRITFFSGCMVVASGMFCNKTRSLCTVESNPGD
jgi:hypothetical protein